MPSDEENTPVGDIPDSDDAPGKNDVPEAENANSTPDPNDDGEEEDTEPDDEETGTKSVTDIEAIVVDPDDVVQAIAYNGQEDIGEKSKVVFSLQPPFDEPVEPTIKHLEEDSTAGQEDDEIHIRPFRFVMDGRQVVEQRPTRQLAKEELGDEDPDETAIEEWIDGAMETWKAHILENFAQSVDIYSSDGMAFIDVEFRSEE
jgi:hypothetical protein